MDHQTWDTIVHLDSTIIYVVPNGTRHVRAIRKCRPLDDTIQTGALIIDDGDRDGDGINDLVIGLESTGVFSK